MFTAHPNLLGQSGEQQAGPRETTSVVSTPRKAGGKSGKKGGRRKKGDMGSADGASAESLGGLGESGVASHGAEVLLNVEFQTSRSDLSGGGSCASTYAVHTYSEHRFCNVVTLHYSVWTDDRSSDAD